MVEGQACRGWHVVKVGRGHRHYVGAGGCLWRWVVKGGPAVTHRPCPGGPTLPCSDRPTLPCPAHLQVCDEGHRLKAAAGNKTIAALTSLGCHRRIILSGTPLQNNLVGVPAWPGGCQPGQGRRVGPACWRATTVWV